MDKKIINTNIESIIKLLPAVSGLIIFIGYLLNHYYYDAFDVDISNYLEFSEILTSFFSHFASILIIFLFLIYSVILNDFFDLYYFNQYFELYFDMLYSANKPKIIDLLSLTKPVIYIVLIIFGAELGSFLVLNVSFDFRYNLKLTISCILSYFLMLNYYNTHRLSRIDPFRSYRFAFTKIVLISLLIFQSIYFLANYRIKSVKKGNGNKIEIQFSDTFIRSDKTNIYLGKTNKYVFIYNISEDATYIYKVENIRSIKIFK